MCCIVFCLQGNHGLNNDLVVYGFAFVDCAALRFWVGFIKDDTSCAALGALLMQVCSSDLFPFDVLLQCLIERSKLGF